MAQGWQVLPLFRIHWPELVTQAQLISREAAGSRGARRCLWALVVPVTVSIEHVQTVKYPSNIYFIESRMPSSLRCTLILLSLWRKSRKRKPTPIFLPGNLHGWRSLGGYSPWGCKEWGATEHACKKKGKNTNYDPLTPARCLHSNFRNTTMWENDQICSWGSNEGEDKKNLRNARKSAWMNRWDWSCFLKKDRVQLEARRVHCYPEMLLLCWHYMT